MIVPTDGTVVSLNVKVAQGQNARSGVATLHNDAGPTTFSCILNFPIVDEDSSTCMVMVGNTNALGNIVTLLELDAKDSLSVFIIADSGSFVGSSSTVNYLIDE